ncbi:MAG: insulinase family protein [Anaerolineales bacterium]
MPSHFPSPFTLLQETQIPEINTLARLYRHEKTGAELLSLIGDDENKVFGITFRTPPGDSTGIAHIMEHSVLCGSRKYPLKEPFVELIKGSLNTFLNAFTYPDKTCYPVASTNLQDFYNLIDVYLDAVFYPLIPPHTLAQEGWHYELDNPGDPLIFKGVVFNEMKGSYSSPDRLLLDHIQQSLFPDNPYRHDSGGAPQAIPNLTYEQFKTFHDTYYHPSNAYIFFYGDDDPEKRLQILDKYLTDFDPLDVDSTIPLQERFTAPRRGAFGYDAGEDTEKKAMLTVNWMLTESTAREEPLALGILGLILSGPPASPWRKALIDSGLGEDLTGGGIENQLCQAIFSVGLKGIAEADAGKVKAVVLETLAALVEDGLDPHTVEASLNTTEFSLRENNTGGFPSGLLFMLRSFTSWLYDADPIQPLFFEAPLTAIKDKLAAGEPYFENLIRQYLLENTHRTTILLKPDSEHRARVEAAERERLDEARAAMSDDDLQAIIADARKLKEIQDTPDSPEALAALPTLKLGDLDKENKRIPTEKVFEHDTPILCHDLFTNGILYLDVGFDLHTLPQDLLPYVPLFGRGLLEMGTETEDFVTLTQRIGRKTGGLQPTTLVSPVHGEEAEAAWLFLRGKGTMSQTGDLMDIVRDILLTVKFDDQDRFRQMVLKAKAGKETGLVPGGHRVVSTRLKAHFTGAHWVSEQMAGLNNLFFVRQLAQDVENDWASVLEKLEKIRALLINRDAMICNVTLDAENWRRFHPELAAFLGELPTASIELGNWTPGSYPTNEGFTLPSQVNFVGKGGNLFDYGYHSHGSAYVIRKYLGTTWLWEKIRVQGGAYGGFVVFDRISGTFNYGSYRDPNLLGTLENYDGTSAFLRNLDLSQDELTKSIIGAIGDIDTYQLPDAKGYTSLNRYLAGITGENRQQLRDEVLSTTQADFKAFGEILEHVNREGHVVVLGSAEAIEDANNQRGGGWLEVTKVL